MKGHRGYWTIIVGAEPTAFRARQRDDLVPTLRQLQRHEPRARLLWFERGRLWASPADAAAARADSARVKPRSKEWRPGGAHRDPRAAARPPARRSAWARRRADKKRANVEGEQAKNGTGSGGNGGETT